MKLSQNFLPARPPLTAGLWQSPNSLCGLIDLVVFDFFFFYYSRIFIKNSLVILIEFGVIARSHFIRVAFSRFNASGVFFFNYTV